MKKKSKPLKMTLKQAEKYLTTIKTKTYQLHLEVTDNPEGEKIVAKFAALLQDCRWDFPLDYINGWMTEKDNKK
jgi:hypothetical protein